MSIFISSGEASGDHYTARLAMKLRERGYSGDIWGMGGVESRNAGVRAEWNGERLQLLGLTEVFSAIPSILALRREMVERIIERAPEAVVVCDSPDYHMRLIAKRRRSGRGAADARTTFAATSTNVCLYSNLNTITCFRAAARARGAGIRFSRSTTTARRRRTSASITSRESLSRFFPEAAEAR